MSVVHASSSLGHGAVLFVVVQPVVGSHASSVHTSPSLQMRADPPHVPPPQWSLTVQALPSLQAALLLVYTHPSEPLHESLVQTLPSLQLSGAPP
jgi:hypothetical protein